MKKLFILFFLLNTVLVFGQDDKRSARIFRSAHWKEGQTKFIYGHNITRIEGSGNYSATNIYFKSQEDLLNDAKIKAHNEMWTEKERVQKIESISSTGGFIYLYILRTTIDAGNTENFQMIFANEFGDEVARRSLSHSIPDYSIVSSLTYWYNIGVVSVPKDLTPPFYVYVIDRLSKPSKYWFKVED